MKISEFRKQSPKELQKTLVKLQEEYYKNLWSFRARQLKETSVKRDIARVKTIISQRELSSERASES